MSQYELDNMASQQNLIAAHEPTDPQPKTSSSSRKAGALKIFLRTIGLKLIPFYFTSNPEEKPKVLIRKSRRVALARCAVHLVPALLTIGLSALNFVGLFIGGELEGQQNDDSAKLGALQIATKIQELLIVASIGSVIFHSLRSEVMFGPGLPLGLLVSGFSFSSISYLLSPEFLGGFKQSWDQPMPSKDKFKRWCFIILVIAGCLLALLSAPATAVLMIPRIKDWNVGGGIYWLSGDDKHLWPTRIDASYYDNIDCTTDAQPFVNQKCPSAGYVSLYQRFANWWILHGRAIDHELLDPFIRKTLYIRPALTKEADTWAYTTHHATAVLQDAMRGIHLRCLEYLSFHYPNQKAFPKHFTWASQQRYEVQTNIPAARVLCNAHDIMNLKGDDLKVKFPYPDKIASFYDGGGSIPGPKIPGLVELDVLKDVKEYLAKRGILDDSNPSLKESIFSDTRSIIMAPIDIWPATNSSLGIVILLKNTWNTTIRTPYTTNVLACSVDARWAKAKSVMSAKWEEWLPHEFHAGRVLGLVKTEMELQTKIGYIRFNPPKNESFRPIRMDVDWYEMLSPTLPDILPNGLRYLSFIGTKMTTLEALVETFYNRDLSQMATFESVIAAQFVEGLSRCGLGENRPHPEVFHEVEMNESLSRSLVHPGGPKETFAEPNGSRKTKVELKAIYTGYVMTCEGWFDWISNIGLLLYAAIALMHSIYILCNGRTSGAWDSILKLVVLCQSSMPPPKPILANTSAGVNSLKTVKSMAGVEVVSDIAASTGTAAARSGGELQLRVRDDTEQRDECLKPAVGAAYGVPGPGYQALRS